MKHSIVTDNRYTITFSQGSFNARMVVCEGKEGFTNVKLTRNGHRHADNLPPEQNPVSDLNLWDIEDVVAVLNECKNYMKQKYGKPV